MTQGQSQGFGSTSALALLSLAVINFVSFLLLQSRLTYPLLELDLLRNLQLSMGLLSGWIVFIVLTGTLLITPFFLEGVMNYSTAKVGLLLAVSPVTSGLIAPLSGRLSDRYGSKAISLLGLGIMISGCLAISTLDGSQTDFEYGLRFLLFGSGLGLFRSPNDSMVMGSVPRDRLGIASGLLSLSRTSGVTVGVPLMGAVFAAISASVAPGTDISNAPKAAIRAGFQGTFQLAALIIVGATVATAISARRNSEGTGTRKPVKQRPSD
jgi:MFS family permease